MTTFAFLRATRFWALCIGAAAAYAKGKGWIGAPEMELIATIMAGFIGIRTIDRYSEQAIVVEAVATGQVPAAAVIKIPPAASDALTDGPAPPAAAKDTR